jgi:hypothetical protein
MEDNSHDGLETQPALTKEQVEMAKFLIEDLHPISKTRLDTAFPFICCPLRMCRKHCGGCFKEE